MNASNLSGMSVMWTLVKREFQEQRALFVYLPVIMALVMGGFFVASLVSSAHKNVFWDQLQVYKLETVVKAPLGSAVNARSSPLAVVSSPFNRTFVGLGVEPSIPTTAEFAGLPVEARANVMRQMYFLPQPFFVAFFWLLMLYYFLMTLYRQRQDRSILFWNSMPVSNAKTIGSKLLAGMLGCQTVFLGCLFCLQLFMLLSLLVYGSFYAIDVWQTFAAPSNLFYVLLNQLKFAARASVWVLPVYAWLLLASAWSRSMPFAWAAAPWVILAGAELFFTKQYNIAKIILEHMLPVAVAIPAAFKDQTLYYMIAEGALSVILGLALIYAAIRFNRSDSI